MTKLNRSETEIVEREKKKIQKKRGGRFKKIEVSKKFKQDDDASNCVLEC